MTETEIERSRRVAEYWRKAYAYESNENDKKRDLPYEPTAVLGKLQPSKLRVSRDGFITLNSDL